jgi:hypothetical protein
MRAFHCLLPAFATLLFTAGCGLDGPPPSDTKTAPPAPQTVSKAGATPSTETKRTDTKQADGTPAGRTPHPVPKTKPPVEAAESAAAQQPAPATSADAHPGVTREAAHVGMGEKGRGYGKGYLAVTLGAYWSAQEMIALERIKHDMQIYKAAEGNYPKNMDEFMEKIIKPANIKLPMLPAGRRYIYDPTIEDYLMVEAPEMDSGESSNGH